MVTVERTLELAKAAYRAKPDSPELLSEFNQAFWNARKLALGVSERDLVVVVCPYKEADIRKFRKDFGLFVPQIVSTAPEGLILLGKAFPRMISVAFQAGTGVSNIDQNGKLIDLHGWMKTEKAIMAPHTLTNQDQAEETISYKDHDRIGDTLNIYAIASQQSKELTGKYLDAVIRPQTGPSESRILSSRWEGRVLVARFRPEGLCYPHQFTRSDYWDGLCYVDRLRMSDYTDYDLGVRSVEVAKTKS